MLLLALLAGGPLGPTWGPGVSAAFAAETPSETPAAEPTDAPVDAPAAVVEAAPGDAPTVATVDAAPIPAGTYVVQAGDTLYSIARRGTVKVDVLVAANKLEDANVIRQGQKLVIPPAGTAGPAVVLEAAQVDAPRSISPVRAAEAPAQGGPVQASASVVTPSPIPEPKPVPSGTPTVTVKTTRVATLAWPIALQSPRIVISQAFRPGHRGIDIAAPTGTPIKAAAGGTVVSSDKGGDGYGWKVILDHGDGVHTWYAHLSELSVAVGDRVATGQQIGLVGSTGHSTGPHLHFELRVNGTHIDPRSVLP